MGPTFKKLLQVTAVGALAFCAIKPAAAATINYTLEFAATGFSPSAAPNNPPDTFVSEKFGFSLDNSADDAGAASTISPDNIITHGTISFSYNQAIDRLTIFGDLNGSSLTPGTNDIRLDISTFSTAPVMAFFAFSQVGKAVVWTTSSGLADLQVVPAVATTPVPAALPLFISALGGIGFLGWRRRKTTAA